MDKPMIDVFQGIGYDCNIFLVNRKVLIDAGTGHNHLIFMKWLKEHTDPKDVHTLILTHRHYDHTGGAAAILSETGARAYIHEADAPPVLNGDEVTTGARTFGGEQTPIDTELIHEGHNFDIDGNVFTVIFTPGHTIGSITLYERENAILFSGDTIFAHGGVGRWDLATGNHTALQNSIEKLTKLEIIDLYPGHDVVVLGKGKEHALLSLESIRQSPLELMMRRLSTL